MKRSRRSALLLGSACVLIAVLGCASAARARVVAMAQDAWEFMAGTYDNTYQHARPASVGSVYYYTFQTDDPSQMAGWGYDQDFQVVTLVAGRTYRFQATPTDSLGADPVLYLYDPNNMTSDPPEVLRRSDDDKWVTSYPLAASFCYTASHSGTYWFSVDDEWGTGFTGAHRTGTYTKGPSYETVVLDEGVRLAPDVRQWTSTSGATPWASDRYWLAAAMAYSFEGDISTFAGVRDVIISSGLEQAAADPLASSGLAGVYNAPLLLVRGDRPTTLPAGTAWALQQIKNDNSGVAIHFHIVGGPASVPDSLKSRILALSTTGSTIERIGGADRYQVAANIAARMRSVLGAGYPHVAFFVNGHDSAYFWNALMCSPVAFRNHWPILLVTKSSVPSVTNTAKGYYNSRFVVASTADVTGANADAIVGSGTGSRIANPTTKGGTAYDREKMARMFAEGAQQEGWLGASGSASVAGMTNKLADSLAGGIFMGRKNGPLLYSDDSFTFSPETEEYLQAWRLDIQRAWCFGGTASFTWDLHNRANALLGGGD
jgi:hypothetical protein